MDLIINTEKIIAVNQLNILLSFLCFLGAHISKKVTHHTKLISNSIDLKKPLAKEYKQRLRSRPFDLGDLKERRN
jgi:hypothetical protein